MGWTAPTHCNAKMSQDLGYGGKGDVRLTSCSACPPEKASKYALFRVPLAYFSVSYTYQRPGKKASRSIVLGAVHAPEKEGAMAMLHNLAAGDDPDPEDPADDLHDPSCQCWGCFQIREQVLLLDTDHDIDEDDE